MAVAHLDGDRNDEGQRLIVSALRGIAGIQVVEFDRTIQVGGTPEIEAGLTRARNLLRESGANLLIWGMWLTSGGKQAAQLYMTPLKVMNVAKIAQQYEADLTLDPAFWGDLVVFVQLVVINYAADVHDPQGCSREASELSALIEDVWARVDGVQAWKWGANTRRKVKLGLALALNTLGELTGDPKRFDEAVFVCRDALRESSRQSDPHAWASVQLVLSLLSMREAPGHLKELSQDLRSALEEFAHPEWRAQRALTRSLLGVVMMMRGMEAPKNERLIKDGIETCQKALNELSRERDPEAWSSAQLMLGTALAASAAEPGNPLQLLDAITTLRSALRQLDRERDSLLWAVTQSKIAYASAKLGELQQSTDLLNEAVAASDEALGVETQECMPLEWAETQVHLGMALKVLGDREREKTALKNSEKAFHEALKVYTHGRMPNQWGLTQMFLAEALSARGERANDAKLICQALYRYYLSATSCAACPSEMAQRSKLAEKERHYLRSHFGRRAEEECDSRISLHLLADPGKWR